MTEDSRSTRPRILVGVDGSPSSEAALRMALQLAERTGAGVTAVCVWTYPAEFPYGLTPPGDAWHPDVDAQQTLDAAVRDVLGERMPVGFEPLVCEGVPAQVLIDLSSDAQMLVLGSRGDDRVAQLLLGSVSEACISHAHCPVLITHER